MEKLTIWKNQKKLLGITNQKIADNAGLPLRTVEQIMCGKVKNPRIDTVQAIERALGLNMVEKVSTQTEHLTKEEQELLTAYRALNGSMQAYVLQIVKAAVSTQETTAKNETKNNIKKIGV